jgi:DNA mismatch repair ATPase MutS
VNNRGNVDDVIIGNSEIDRSWVVLSFGRPYWILLHLFFDDISSSFSLFLRTVSRLVSPGTATEPSYLNPRSHNYLCAIYPFPEDQTLPLSPTSSSSSYSPPPILVGLCWSDLSTGQVFYATSSSATLESELLRIQPSEVLLPPSAPSRIAQIASPYLVTPCDPIELDSKKIREQLQPFFAPPASHQPAVADDVFSYTHYSDGESVDDVANRLLHNLHDGLESGRLSLSDNDLTEKKVKKRKSKKKKKDDEGEEDGPPIQSADSPSVTEEVTPDPISDPIPPPPLLVTSDFLLDLNVCECAAMLSLLKFARSSAPKASLSLNVPEKYGHTKSVRLDACTKQCLELTRCLYPEARSTFDVAEDLDPADSSKSGVTPRYRTLLTTLDATVSSGGGRMLAEDLSSPLLSSEEINLRLDAVSFLRRRPDLILLLRTQLRKIHDIERCMQRISIGRGTSRDILAIGTTLQAIGEIVKQISEHTSDQSSRDPPPLISLLLSEVSAFPTMSALILKAISSSPPLLTSLPGHIADGFCPDLDNLRNSTQSGHDAIAELLLQLKSESGINGLKISRCVTFNDLI